MRRQVVKAGRNARKGIYASKKIIVGSASFGLAMAAAVWFSGPVLADIGEPFLAEKPKPQGCTTHFNVPGKNGTMTVQKAVNAAKRCGPGVPIISIHVSNSVPHQGSVVIKDINRHLEIIGVDASGQPPLDPKNRAILVPDVGKTCIDFQNKDERITIAIKNIKLDAHDLFRETCVSVKSGRAIISDSSVELHKTDLPAIKIVGGTATIERSRIVKGSEGVLIMGTRGDKPHEIHENAFSGQDVAIKSSLPTNIVSNDFSGNKNKQSSIVLTGGGSVIANDISGPAFNPEKHTFSIDKSSIVIDPQSGRKDYVLRNNTVSGGHGYGVYLKSRVEGGEFTFNKLTDVPSCGVSCAPYGEGSCLPGDIRLTKATSEMKDKDAKKKATKAERRDRMCGFSLVRDNEVGGVRSRRGCFRWFWQPPKPGC